MTNSKQINVFDISNYIMNSNYVIKNEKDMGLLKLNKLIYYCYAKYLVETGQQLFSNVIQAWRYGPVIRDLYYAGKKKISTVSQMSGIALNEKQKEIIDYVLEKLGHLEPWDLTIKSHEEAPWYETMPGDKIFSRRQITDDKILKYFSKHKI